MYIETLRMENESLHLELMRREHKKISSLSIKAQEFRPKLRFSIKAKEFVPELNEEMKEKENELNQLLAPFSVNAKGFIPATCLYRYF